MVPPVEKHASTNELIKDMSCGVYVRAAPWRTKATIYCRRGKVTAPSDLVRFNLDVFYKDNTTGCTTDGKWNKKIAEIHTVWNAFEFGPVCHPSIMTHLPEVLY